MAAGNLEVMVERGFCSHLVNVEFKDGLLGCKKSMSRDVTSLVTHENSRRSRLKFPLLHCIVHVSLEGQRCSTTFSPRW